MATENKKGGGILKLRIALAFAKSRITSCGVTVINISYLRIQVNTQTSEIHPH